MTDDHALAQLHKLMTEGTIWQEGNELVGRATDGTIVCLEGDMRDPKAPRRVARYIAAHPTPDTW